MLSRVLHQARGVEFLNKVVENKLKTPLLLVGPEGVGRRYSVVQALKEMYCREGRQVDCKCYDCVALEDLMHPDLQILSGDEKDIGVEAIRGVVSTSYSFPSSGPVRAFIIDGADRITIPAANALLKTLEEPPDSARFFLLSETYDKVLPTIRSRCGEVVYGRLPESFIVERLRELEYDAAKALIYARMAEGSIGQAAKLWGSERLRLRDQVISLISHGLAKNLAALFAQMDELGSDLSLALTLLDQVLHDLLILDVDPTRLINLDALEQLVAMSKRGSDTTWVNLRAELNSVKNHFSRVPIHLPFHVKTSFVQSFFTF